MEEINKYSNSVDRVERRAVRDGADIERWTRLGRRPSKLVYAGI
jgi:hypothetical protein